MSPDKNPDNMGKEINMLNTLYKFKIGDRIQVKASQIMWDRGLAGRAGVIKEMSGARMVKVYFDGNSLSKHLYIKTIHLKKDD